MIYLPPPQPVLNKDIRVSGDVEIHPTASLAPGVILQAAPNSRIVIGADVCIGMGVIINACQGLVEIESGAILGSGVLIMGASKIGSNSCIGTATTIWQQDVATMAVVEPGSILGDTSRQVDLSEQQTKVTSTNTNYQSTFKQPKSASENELVDHWYEDSTIDSGKTTVDNSRTQSTQQNFNPNSEKVKEVITSVEPHVQPAKSPVVGQVYINELLVTLFPHKKNSQPNSPNSNI